MKLNLLKDGIIIVPETDFEATYLRSLDCDNVTIFHKCGISASDYLGMKIVSKQEQIKSKLTKEDIDSLIYQIERTETT